MQHYKFNLEEAKRTLLKAVMGFAAPPEHNRGDAKGALPFVESLAFESRRSSPATTGSLRPRAPARR